MASELAPCVPLWLALERGALMPIDRRILTCTAFIGEPLGERFGLDGSGFFVQVWDGEYSFPYLITAQHVVNPSWTSRQAPWPPEGKAHIRINRKSGEAPFVLSTERAEWLYPQDRRAVDLCAFQFDEQKYNPNDEVLAIGALNIATLSVLATSPFARPITLALGDAVFMTGAFNQRTGEKKNIPIVRQGTIAALLDEPIEHASPRHPAYLIETRSLGGVSGSPVFFDPNSRQGTSGMGYGPARVIDPATGKQGPETTIVPYRLVGMILGTWDVDDMDSLATHDRSRRPDTDFNSGISIAMSVSQIIDFLDSEPVKQQRERTIEARRATSGYRETSSGRRSKPPTSDENPQHKENFKRLLSAASKPKPKGGRT